MAYEWLDAQNVRATPTKEFCQLKYIIERWTGRYISETDVGVAAAMHPRIRGKYPNFNLSARLVLPSDRRLQGIGEALTQQGYRDLLDPKVYAMREEP